MDSPANTVALLVTCLVDTMRPRVALATVKLLETVGCTVVVPRNQTCCGQPALNAGDLKTAAAIARQVITTFESYDHVVVPSGSCAATVIAHYAELFEPDSEWHQRATALAAKTHELTRFLTEVRPLRDVQVRYDGVASYHDSCSGLRELNIRQQPRMLLEQVDGLTLTTVPGAEECCGFGGAFSVKYPDISGEIVDKKATNLTPEGVDTILGGDLGCLMNIAGRLRRRKSSVEVRHVAEVLADMADGPPIAGSCRPTTPTAED